LNPVRSRKEKAESAERLAAMTREMVSILRAYYRTVVKLNLLRFQVFVLKKVFQILLP